MEVTNELISDLVRVLLGGKDDDRVWSFTAVKDRVGKCIRFREGDGVEATKTKVIGELNIDRTSEKVELTYEMPEWMDIDGSVKPVPIHIVIDDNMGLFLAMRVDIHEMNLYVVPMPLNMTLEIDGFKVVPIMDEFSFAEVMSKAEIEREKKRREDKEAVDNIICTQLPPEHVADNENGLLGWVGHSYTYGGFVMLSAALRNNKVVSQSGREMNPDGRSSADNNNNWVTRLTRYLFTKFEKAGNSSEERGSQADTQIHATGLGDVSPPRGGDELFDGRVFKNKDDCKVKIVVHAINRKFSFRSNCTTNDVVIVWCISDACYWRIYYVRLEDTEYFKI
ncbi:unnamed protein product [Arabidopsis arenosa]|uniref:Transposase MuDR plant domain-containing protein n=1 Tax=Arabidopsis arenosa TaxID=38785 RepID=A0A8S2A412_ARAAE|nr:unnamed protein product [Arabidopsis arenosa]